MSDVPLGDRIARVLCDKNERWEHHDQTDDYPCTRCREDADAVLAALDPAEYVRGLAEDDRIAAAVRQGIRESRMDGDIGGDAIRALADALPAERTDR